jgi:hypothetical protein
MARIMTPPSHLDEIAGLLARGYVRLRQKESEKHTPGEHSLDDREISLDAIRPAEPFIGTERIAAEGGC